MKFSIKRLSESDLGTVRSFFHANEERKKKIKQKAIILSVDVFKSQQFPGADENSVYYPEFTIYGPKNTHAIKAKRHLRKQHKNWRIDGGFLPTGNIPERFDTLDTNDFVLIGITAHQEIDSSFGGLFAEPQEVPGADGIIAFISRADSPELWEEIEGEMERFQTFPDGSLRNRAITHIVSPPAITDKILNNFLINQNTTDEFEIRLEGLTDSELIEEAAQGSDGIAQAVIISRGGKKYTPEEIEDQKKKLSETGRLGEKLVFNYLSQKQSDGFISELQWIAKIDGYSPYDISFKDTSTGSLIRVDVKSTTGRFITPIHISFAELKSMQDSSSEYYIYRVYNISADSAKLKISNPLSGFSQSLLNWSATRSEGIEIDSFSISPELIVPPSATEVAI